MMMVLMVVVMMIMVILMIMVVMMIIMLVTMMISISCAKGANFVPMRSEKLLNSASFGCQNLKPICKVKNEDETHDDDDSAAKI